MLYLSKRLSVNPQYIAVCQWVDGSWLIVMASGFHVEPKTKKEVLRLEEWLEEKHHKGGTRVTLREKPCY